MFEWFIEVYCKVCHFSTFLGGLYKKVSDWHCSLPIPSALAFLFPFLATVVIVEFSLFLWHWNGKLIWKNYYSANNTLVVTINTDSCRSLSLVSGCELSFWLELFQWRSRCQNPMVEFSSFFGTNMASWFEKIVTQPIIGLL